MLALYVLILLVLVALLIYVVYKGIRENYNQEEDPYTRKLANELRIISPEVAAAVDRLKFYDGGNRSYTLNKSETFLCKVNKHGEEYNLNQLRLVLIHEIAHALCNSVGHTDEFNSIFQDLLKKAEAKGLYNPNIKSDPDYCTY